MDKKGEATTNPSAIPEDGTRMAAQAGVGVPLMGARLKVRADKSDRPTVREEALALAIRDLYQQRKTSSAKVPPRLLRLSFL